MRGSESVRAFIKAREGLRLTAYRCPSGVWTVGYGHTGSGVGPGLRVSRDRAEALFEGDLAPLEAQLSVMCSGIEPPLRQGQFDALLSFAFNVGLGALRGSTLWRKARRDPSDPTIPAEFGRWVYGGGARLPGLESRRRTEAEMWQAAAGDEENKPLPPPEGGIRK